MHLKLYLIDKISVSNLILLTVFDGRGNGFWNEQNIAHLKIFQQKLTKFNLNQVFEQKLNNLICSYVVMAQVKQKTCKCFAESKSFLESSKWQTNTTKSELKGKLITCHKNTHKILIHVGLFAKSHQHKQILCSPHPPPPPLSRGVS